MTINTRLTPLSVIFQTMWQECIKNCKQKLLGACIFFFTFPMPESRIFHNFVRTEATAVRLSLLSRGWLHIFKNEFTPLSNNWNHSTTQTRSLPEWMLLLVASFCFDEFLQYMHVSSQEGGCFCRSKLHSSRHSGINSQAHSPDMSCINMLTSW